MSEVNPFKNTIDKLLGDLRKVCHSMIDQNYISESPIKLVQEALDYLDKQNIDKAKTVQTKESNNSEAGSEKDHECCGGGCHS